VGYLQPIFNQIIADRANGLGTRTEALGELCGGEKVTVVRRCAKKRAKWLMYYRKCE